MPAASDRRQSRQKYPGYHVLNKCEIAGHEIDFLLVDLRRIFTLSVDAARAFAGANGKKRLRLLLPYREHLAQAFVRFFMRIGLPVDIPPFRCPLRVCKTKTNLRKRGLSPEFPWCILHR